jgi:hypothetical protein
MNKLEALKKAFEAQKMSDMLPKLAHNSWCATQMGNSYQPSAEQLDDMYVTLVSHGTSSAPGDKSKAEGYMKLWYSLTEMGTQVFPYEDWLKTNPESERWAEWIEEAIMIENIYRSNPEKWLTDFRTKLSAHKNLN